MDIPVTGDGYVQFNDERLRCALGRGGVVNKKHEGDGATPCARMKILRVLFRPDRLASPSTALPVAALTPQDGWCDDPASIDYNQQVTLPHPARCEKLWRDDGRYDVIGVLGWNDDPVTPGLGSAIFLHVAAADFSPTEGCIALALPDVLRLLAACRPGDALVTSL